MALSCDIRERVLAAIAAEGLSRRAAAKRFVVSIASVVRWKQRFDETGETSPRPTGGDQRSTRIEAHKAYLLGLARRQPDLTLEEISQKLQSRGETFSTSVIDRFFVRHGITFKKTAHASEQGRWDVKARRLAWFEDQVLLDPARLVFIDETGATTNMARRYGRCKRGKRLRAAIPHGHYKTLTFVSGLRLNGLVAPRALDGPMNAERFEAWLRDDLGPTLEDGDIIVMDNLQSHKSERVKSILERFGASVLYLPPYSPDLNPIEKAYAKLKAYLRKLAERTVSGLMALLETCADIFKPKEAANFFAACGYDTD